MSWVKGAYGRKRRAFFQLSKHGASSELEGAVRYCRFQAGGGSQVALVLSWREQWGIMYCQGFPQ